jgi:hypothetical protein
VPEAGRGAGLLKKARGGVARRHEAPEQLDRDIDVEDRVARQPHLTHAAPAEDAGEPILPGDQIARHVRWLLRLLLALG